MNETRGSAIISMNTVIAEKHMLMRAEYTGNKPEELPEPGQFFTILPPSWPVNFIRRPFAYSAADNNGFSFIYEIRGAVTKELSMLEKGSLIDWIGPLGKGYPLTAGTESGIDNITLNNSSTAPENSKISSALLTSGGAGIGPILFLAERLAEMGSKVLMVSGYSTASFVPDIDYPSGIEVRICTDDGSKGIAGNVSNGIFPADFNDSPVLYSCGPSAMMKAVHKEAEKRKLKCYLSMEAIMACGVGACAGCAVKTKTGYRKACKDGPVFNSEIIEWQ